MTDLKESSRVPLTSSPRVPGAPKESARSLSDIMELPGVIGCVSCNANGQTTEVLGDEAEVLGDVLVYFAQIANLIGENCGLERMTEGHIIGQSVTAVCLSQGENTLGVLFGAKARPAQVIPMIVKE